MNQEIHLADWRVGGRPDVDSESSEVSGQHSHLPLWLTPGQNCSPLHREEPRILLFFSRFLQTAK